MRDESERRISNLPLGQDVIGASLYACAWRCEPRCVKFSHHIVGYEQKRAPLCDEHYERAQRGRGQPSTFMSLSWREPLLTRQAAGLSMDEEAEARNA